MAETFFREALLEAATSEMAETGLARLSFCSELPVLRVDEKRGKYWEILSMSPGDANLGFLNRSGVVLEDHDERREIGEVVRNSARVEADGKARATIRLTDPYWKNRAAAGKADSVSVGYRLLSELSREVGEDGIKKIRFSFSPFEISLLTGPPADDTVGINRSKNMKNQTLETLLEAALSGSRQTEDHLTREACRPASILSIMRRQSEGALIPKSQSLELDLHTACARTMPCGRNGLCGAAVPFAAAIPDSGVTRDMQANVFGAGGAAVPASLGPVVDLLRNVTVLVASGVTVVENLTADYLAPRITGDVTPAVATEIGLAQESDLTLDQTGLKPMRITAQVKFSLQLLLQTDGAAEQIIRRAIQKAIAVKLDTLGLFGLGFNSEPLGLLNTPGIGVVTAGGAMTWPTILAMEQQISLENGDNGGMMSWAISPNTRNKWKAASRIAATNFPSFIMEDGRANGYAVRTSNQLTAQNQALFGSWPSFYMLLYGAGFDMTTDCVTQAVNGLGILTVHLWANFFAGHIQAFSATSDSAAQ